MKAKFKNMLVQVLSLILVITLAIPSQVFAASSTRKKANTYNSSRSIMGLATSAATNPSDLLENNSKKTVYISEITSEETDLYQVDKSATVDTQTGKITYRIAVIDRNPVDTYPADGLETLSTSFAINANANHNDIQVEKVVGLDQAGKEVDFASKISRPNIFENNDYIKTLAIKSDKPQYGVVYYLSSSLDDLAIEYFTKDELATEKSPIFSIDMAIKNQDGKSIYLDRYSLRPNENTETEIQIDEAGNIIEEADPLALADDEKSKLVDGRYIEESKSIISHTPATIKWQDFIFPENDQSFRYDIKVDDKQDTTNSEIKVEFYEARDNGFVINNSFTQNFPFADYLDIKIPEGQFVRLSFQTTLATDKKVQTYSYNGKEINNPAYDPAAIDQADKDESAKTEQTSEAEEDPLPNNSSKTDEGSNSSNDIITDQNDQDFSANPKTEKESEPTETSSKTDEGSNSSKDIIADKSDQDFSANSTDEKESTTTNTLSKNDPGSNSSNDIITDKSDQNFSAISLNKDSLISTLTEDKTLTEEKKQAIILYTNSLEAYNDGQITKEELISELKATSADSKLSKEETQDILEGLIIGLDKDTHKVADLDPADLANQIDSAAEQKAVPQVAGPEATVPEDFINTKVKEKLAEPGITIEDFQNYMNELEEKYNLTNEDADRIYTANADAIQKLIEKYREENTIEEARNNFAVLDSGFSNERFITEIQYITTQLTSAENESKLKSLAQEYYNDNNTIDIIRNKYVGWKINLPGKEELGRDIQELKTSGKYDFNALDFSLYAPAGQSLANYKVVIEDAGNGNVLAKGIMTETGTMMTYGTSISKSSLPDAGLNIYVIAEAPVKRKEYNVGLKVSPDHNYVMALKNAFEEKFEELKKRYPLLIKYINTDQAEPYKNGINLIDTRMVFKEPAQDLYQQMSKSTPFLSTEYNDNNTDTNTGIGNNRLSVFGNLDQRGDLTWTVSELITLETLQSKSSIGRDAYTATSNGRQLSPEAQLLIPKGNSYEVKNLGGVSQTNLVSQLLDIPGTIVNYTYKDTAFDIYSENTFRLNSGKTATIQLKKVEKGEEYTNQDTINHSKRIHAQRDGKFYEQVLDLKNIMRAFKPEDTSIKDDKRFNDPGVKNNGVMVWCLTYGKGDPSKARNFDDLLTKKQLDANNPVESGKLIYKGMFTPDGETSTLHKANMTNNDYAKVFEYMQRIFWYAEQMRNEKKLDEKTFSKIVQYNIYHFTSNRGETWYNGDVSNAGGAIKNMTKDEHDLAIELRNRAINANGWDSVDRFNDVHVFLYSHDSKKYQQVISGDVHSKPASKGSISIKKIDSDTNRTISNVGFKLTSIKDGKTYSGNTDSNGALSFNELPLGEYTLEETSAPAGYVLEKGKRTIFLTAENADQAFSVAYYNRRSKIEFIKVDENSKIIPGATFELRQNGRTLSGYDKSADSSGKFGWIGLTQGTYEVYEKSLPSGYENYKDNLGKKVAEFTIDGQNNVSAITNLTNSLNSKSNVIINKANYGNFKIKKVDIAGKPLEKVGFTLYTKKGDLNSAIKYNNQTEFFTNKDGYLYFSNLPNGTYYLKETTVPAGYTVTNDGWTDFKVENGKVTSTTAKVVADTGNTNPGSGDNNTQPGTTNPTPNPDPKPNEPVYETVQRDSWNSDTKSYVASTAYPSYMNTKDFSVLTNPSTGEITTYILLKPNGNNGGSGTDRDTILTLNAGNATIKQVDLYRVNNKTNASNAMTPTLISGQFSNGNINKPPTNENGQKYPISIDGKSGIYLSNSVATNKTSVDIKSPYQRFDNDWTSMIVVKSYVTDKSSEATFNYKWDTDRYGSSKNGSSNYGIYTSILSDTTHIPAIEYQRQVSKVNNATTNLADRVMDFLAPTVHATSAQPDYSKVEISNNKPNGADSWIEYEIKNEPNRIEFTKAFVNSSNADIYGMKVSVLSNNSTLPTAIDNEAQFVLTVNKTNPTDADPIKLSLTGNSFGWEKLPQGSYTLKEVAPKGFKPANDIKFTVGADGKITYGSRNDTNITQIIINTKETLGKFTLEKVDTNISTITTSEAKFTLKRKSDNKYVYYENETLKLSESIKTIETSNGKITFDNLPIGEYELEENAAPTGYKKDSDKWTVKVSESGTTISGPFGNNAKIDGSNIKVINEESPIDIEFIKVGLKCHYSDPNDIYNGTLEGAEIKLQKLEENEYKDTGQSETSDANGVVKFEGLTAGEYQLIETTVPDGYRNPGGPVKKFTVKMTENGLKAFVNGEEELISSGDNQNNYIYNEQKGKGELKVTKKGEGSELLNGADFTLYRFEFTDSADSIETITTGQSGENGVAHFKNLPYGKYWLVETKSPDGYIRNPEPRLITISHEYNVPQIAGKDVSSQLTLNRSSDPLPSIRSSSGSEYVVFPNSAEGLKANLNYKVDRNSNIEPGDYFYVSTSDNLDIGGIFDDNSFAKTGGLDIVGSQGTIAKAIIETINEKSYIKYTFTDYVSSRRVNDINLYIPMFVDRYKVRYSTVNNPIPLEVGISIPGQLQNKNKHVLSDSIRVDYEDIYRYQPSANMVNSYTLSVDSNGRFRTVVYINQNQRYTWNKNITFSPNLNVKDLKYRVYQANTRLPMSYGLNESELRNPINTFTKDALNAGNYDTIYIGPENQYNTNTYYLVIDGTITNTNFYEFRNIVTYNSYIDNCCNMETYRWENSTINCDLTYNPGETTERTMPVEVTVPNSKNQVEYTKIEALPEEDAPKDGSQVTNNTDESINKIDGAKFELRKLDETTSKYEKVQGSDQESKDGGKLKWTGLDPGKYEVWETEATEGYNLPTKAVAKFTVDVNGAVSKVERDKDNKDKVISQPYIGNSKTAKAKFRLLKTKEDGSALEGVTFELRNADGSVFDTKKSDANGQIIFENLDPDTTYTLVETESVSQYMVTGNTWSVDVDQAGKVTIKPIDNSTANNGLGLESVIATAYAAEANTTSQKADFFFVIEKDDFNKEGVDKFNNEFQTFRQSIIDKYGDNARIAVVTYNSNNAKEGNQVYSLVKASDPSLNNVKIETYKDPQGYKWPHVDHGLDSVMDMVDDDRNIKRNMILITSGENALYFNGYAPKYNISENFDDVVVYSLSDKTETEDDNSPVIDYASINLVKDNKDVTKGSLESWGTFDKAEAKFDIADENETHIDYIENLSERDLAKLNSNGYLIANTSATGDAAEDELTTIKVVNRKPTYPATGGSGTTLAFAIIGTAVMILGIAYYGINNNGKKRRRRR